MTVDSDPNMVKVTHMDFIFFYVSEHLTADRAIKRSSY